MRNKTSKDLDGARLSRREFSRVLATGAVTTALARGGNAAEHEPEPGDSGYHSSYQGNTPDPSPEAESQYKLLISKYGARLSDEQKADVKRLIDQGLKSAVTLRSFQLDNADEPANVFRARLTTIDAQHQ